MNIAYFSWGYSEHDLFTFLQFFCFFVFNFYFLSVPCKHTPQFYINENKLPNYLLAHVIPFCSEQPRVFRLAPVHNSPGVPYRDHKLTVVRYSGERMMPVIEEIAVQRSLLYRSSVLHIAYVTINIEQVPTIKFMYQIYYILYII